MSNSPAIAKQLEKKRLAKANTDTQLAALEAKADALSERYNQNRTTEARLRASAQGVRDASSTVEVDVKEALKTQEKVDAAMAAMLKQTARLEAKVKSMDAEKARLIRKISNYEEVTQQFCFSFGDVFGAPSSDYETRRGN